MTIYAIVGVFGFAVYALSFAGVQLGRLNGNSARYSAMNACAAGLVLVSNIDQFNLSSVLISAFFLATGAAGLASRRQASAQSSLTKDRRFAVVRSR